MQDGVEVPGHMDELRDICTHESEPVALQKVFHVAGIAGGEIVETDEFVAFIQEALTEVRSKKASPSRHCSASMRHCPPSSRTRVVQPPTDTRTVLSPTTSLAAPDCGLEHYYSPRI